MLSHRKGRTQPITNASQIYWATLAAAKWKPTRPHPHQSPKPGQQNTSFPRNPWSWGSLHRIRHWASKGEASEILIYKKADWTGLRQYAVPIGDIIRDEMPTTSVDQSTLLKHKSSVTCTKPTGSISTKSWPHQKQTQTCSDYSGVAPLKMNGKLINIIRDKAEAFNEQFQSVFTRVTHLDDIRKSKHKAP